MRAASSERVGVRRWRSSPAARAVAAFVRARLAPGEALGLHLTIALVLIVLGSWAFAGLVDMVHEQNSLAALDGSVARWLHAHASPNRTGAARALTQLGSPGVVLVVAAAAGSALGLRRRLYESASVSLSVGGGLLVNTLIKNIVDRDRPVFDPPLARALGFSFPSGHVAGAALLYGSLAVLAWRTLPRARDRVLAVLAAQATVTVVALTRMYLGVHYLTDVLAAETVAVVWIAACFTGLHMLRLHRAAKHHRAPEARA